MRLVTWIGEGVRVRGVDRLADLLDEALDPVLEGVTILAEVDEELPAQLTPDLQPTPFNDLQRNAFFSAA